MTEMPVELYWSPTGNQVLFRSGSKYFRVGDGGHGGYPKLPSGSVRLVPEDNGSITEYATAYKGGDMHLFVDEPEVEAVYPMAKRIASEQRFGGKVYQRIIKLVEDWKEVPKS